MNTFEHHLFADWTACASLALPVRPDEADRRLAALIALMERCQTGPGSPAPADARAGVDQHRGRVTFDGTLHWYLDNWRALRLQARRQGAANVGGW